MAIIGNGYTLLMVTMFVANVSPQSTSLVDYYVNLVTRYIDEYMNYTVKRNADQFRPKNSELSYASDYDFIVIGSGAGGSVVAGRLSEEEDFNVLLLEAGEHENNFTDIPYTYFYLAKSPYNWGYLTVPQKNCCLGMVDRRCPHHRGKGLGGTTVINGLVYNRGPKEDYYDWASESPGWNYSDVLPYFVRGEDSQIDGDDGYHGIGGKMHVEYNCIQSPQLDAFLAANRELGRPTLDYNGRSALGASRTQMNKIRGSRMSAARAHVRPVMDVRENLEVSVSSYATEIVLDGKGESLRAIGVKFNRDGRRYFSKAKKEVIVAAGAFNTPHLLMLSGIGPRRHLRQKKIAAKADLQVGSNLHDHTTFYGINVATNYSEPIENVREYVAGYLQGCGPYSVPGNNQGLGFWRTKYATRPGVPDIEVMMIPANRTNPIYQEYMNYDDDTYRALTNVIDNTRTFIVYVILLRPLSVGAVTLNSNNPYEYPSIDPRYLSHPRDIEVLLEGYKMVNQLVNTNAFRNMGANMRIARLPGCRQYGYLSDEYMRCFIRHTTANIYHPVGTAKMGRDPKRGAVVDSQLNVHGVKNLRVVDGSVLPFSFHSHPSAIISMVGERASCFIKTKYGKRC